MNMDIFQLFFNYLEERPYNNIYQNVKQDTDYTEATIQETKLNDQYKKLDLSDVFLYCSNWLIYKDRQKISDIS